MYMCICMRMYMLPWLPFLLMLLMLLLTLIALVLGYAVASDNRTERSTIPLVMAMRNPGLALLLVQQMAPEASDLKAAIVGYVVMTAIGMTPFLR